MSDDNLCDVNKIRLQMHIMDNKNFNWLDIIVANQIMRESEVERNQK